MTRFGVNIAESSSEDGAQGENLLRILQNVGVEKGSVLERLVQIIMIVCGGVDVSLLLNQPAPALVEKLVAGVACWLAVAGCSLNLISPLFVLVASLLSFQSNRGNAPV